MLRRILLLLTVALMLVAMLAVMAAPAFARNTKAADNTSQQGFPPPQDAGFHHVGTFSGNTNNCQHTSGGNTTCQHT